MKIRFLILLPLLLAPLAGAQTNTPPISIFLAKLDTQYGFRDLKFEQSIDSCPGMTLLEDDDVIKFYARKTDSLDLGSAKLKSVEYEFYKGKLYTVTITSEAGPNGAALLKEFEQEYGPAHKSPHNPNKAYWYGDKVTGDYLVSTNGQASVNLWSKAIQNLRAADAKAKH